MSLATPVECDLCSSGERVRRFGGAQGDVGRESRKTFQKVVRSKGIFFLLFRAVLTAYGGSQAQGQIRATAAGLRHSHSHAGSKLGLRTTPQLTAMLDP